MEEKVLFVDDEDNVLNALRRQFRKQFDVHTALGGSRALQLISSEGPFAVIVSDMQMPGMNGVEFLRAAQELAPDSVRLMLTGNADQATAVEAVNEGSVFSFLTKPCPPELMVSSVKRAVDQYHMICAERDLLEGTLNGSVKLLMDIMSMVAPDSSGQAVTVRDMAIRLAEVMRLENVWDLELAAMLSCLANVTLPPETQEKIRSGGVLSREEQQVIERLPETGSNLIRNIPRLERVAEIVRYQQKHFDGSGYPADEIAGENIPRESRMLKILADLEAMMSQGIEQGEAVERMQSMEGVYDPVILCALSGLLGSSGQDVSPGTLIMVSLNGLQPGHVLVSDIETTDGRLLFAAGQTITPAIRERLINHGRITQIREPIQVYSDNEQPGESLAG